MRMTIVRDGHFEARLVCHVVLLIGLALALTYSLGIPAFSMTFRHLAVSAASRSCICCGVLPVASMPRLRALALSAGSDRAWFTATLRVLMISGGTFADAPRPFQLVTT